MNQSYILDGTRHTVTRNPETGECVLCKIIEKTGELVDEMRWQTRPDGDNIAPAPQPENAQNAPEMPGNARRKAQKPVPVLEGQAALF